MCACVCHCRLHVCVCHGPPKQIPIPGGALVNTGLPHGPEVQSAHDGTSATDGPTDTTPHHQIAARRVQCGKQWSAMNPVEMSLNAVPVTLNLASHVYACHHCTIT